MSQLFIPSLDYLDLIPLACCHADKNYLITYMNLPFLKLFKAEIEKDLGKDIRQFLPELGNFNFIKNKQSDKCSADHFPFEYFSIQAQCWIALTTALHPDGAVISFSAINRFKKKEEELIKNQVELIADVESLKATVKQQKIEMSANQELLEALVDNSLSYIHVLSAVRNEDGKIIDFQWKRVNRSYAERYGDMKGKSLLTENPALLKTGIFNSMCNIVETGIAQFQEHHYQHEKFDGWFHQVLVKMDDGFIMTTNDITARKVAEERLMISERRLSLFVSASADLVYEMNADWTQMYELKGKYFSADSVIPNSEWMRKYIPESEQPRVNQAIKTAIAEKQTFELEHRIIKHDLSTGWTHSKAVPILNENGEISEWFGTSKDISVRKLSEEEIFKNYSQLQQSEQLAGAGTWEYNLVEKSLVWSDGMYRMFGLSNDVTVTPDIYLDFVVPDSFEITQLIIETICSGKKDYEETIEILISGVTKVLQLKATVIRNALGQPLRILGVDMDITGIRNAERKLHELQASQQQDILRATLNAQEGERRRISESLHNGLGQLLYGIKLAMNSLNITLAAESPSKFNDAKKYTEELLTEAIRECRLLSHKLVPTILAEFGLSVAINDICDQMKSAVTIRNTVRLAGVKLDNYLELAVFRTVQELTMNLVKHSHATFALVEVVAESGNVLVRVSDNGRGNAITGDSTGKNGIGLFSIHRKAELLNGSVVITSSPEEGTIVEVKFPLQQ